MPKQIEAPEQIGMNLSNRLPIQSRSFWTWLLSFFVIALVLTMLKDQWLTGDEPNVAFYAIVPSLSILGGALSMFAAARAGRQSLSFFAMLAINIGANTVMQILEIVLKLVYYLLWQYPGLLYIALVFPLGFLLLAYGLVRWCKVTWWVALILSFVDFAGSMTTGIFLTEVLGLTTPGS